MRILICHCVYAAASASLENAYSFLIAQADQMPFLNAPISPLMYLHCAITIVL